MARIFVALVMLLVGCSQGPASGATPVPTATPAVVPPTATATATAQPTTAQPTPSPVVTTPPASRPASCDPYYSNCEPRYTPRATPPGAATPAGHTLVVGVSAAGFLVDPDGMSLYILDNDTSGEPTCLSGCSDNWPPLTVSADGTVQPVGGPGVNGAFSTFDRNDAATQVIYDDQPLYYFSGDSAPGDKNGDGTSDVWHLATP